MKKAIWLIGGLTLAGVGVIPVAANPLPSAPVVPQVVLPVAPDCPATADCLEPEADPMGQVRSVSEFSDVQPTDWAYQTLRTLVERYGVLSGYPDGTFRGDRTLTRNEFAVVLSRVLDRVEQQIASGDLERVREDFSTLRRLQESYGRISSSLRDRLDRLEMATDQLENRNFSRTTKLSGETVFALTDGTRARTTIVSRTRLSLNTSFTGTDTLLTQLEAGNNGGDAVSRSHNSRQNLLGTTGILADGGGLDYVEYDSIVRVSKLYYTFQPTANLSLTIGARLNPRDFIDYNRFANDSTFNFASSFFTNNPLIVQNAIDRPGGAGAVVTWKPTEMPLILRALYVAADANLPNAEVTEGGLFGDRHQGSLELEYGLSRDITLRLQYTKALVNGLDISAGGLNAEWEINRTFAVFGRYGIGSYEGFNPLLNQDLNLNPQTWTLGISVRNIVIPGSTAGLAVGRPFIEHDLGNATQTNIEGYYSFLLNDRINVSPGFLIVTNPNNNKSSGTIWEWFLRMAFSF